MILKFSLLPVTVQHDWFGFHYSQVGLTAWLCWVFPPWGRASGRESLLHLFAVKSSGVYQEQAVSQHHLCLRSDIQAAFVNICVLWFTWKLHPNPVCLPFCTSSAIRGTAYQDSTCLPALHLSPHLLIQLPQSRITKT